MYGEAEIEASEAALTGEREREIARIRATLKPAQPDAVAADCSGCGDPIPEARRKALPSAERCVGCQAKWERRYA